MNRYKKKRCELLLETRAFEIIDDIAKTRKTSRNEVINEVILQKLRDPIQVIDDELREHAIAINELQARREKLVNGDAHDA